MRCDQIWCVGTGIGVLIGLDFNAILCIDNFFAAASAALEFLAALKLRHSRPDLPRPYRVPLSTMPLAILYTFPVCCETL